jgi:hypothetical protein
MQDDSFFKDEIIDILLYEKEFIDLNLGDKRLNKRFKTLISGLNQNIDSSIPVSQQTNKDTKAAYRFFDNENISIEKIMEPHYNSTLKRLKYKKNIILAIQDTSYIIHTHHQATKGLGRIYKNDDNTNAFLIHPTMAFTTSGIPLGLIDIQMWARGKEDNSLTKSEKFLHRLLDEKESKKMV